MGNKVATTSPVPVGFSGADIDRLLFDLNSAFNPLHTACQVDFHVSAVKDGYVFLSVALPEGMTRAYVALLESLGGLVRCIDVKSRSVAAQARPVDVDVQEYNRQRVADFEAKAVLRYDGYIADGCDSAEAIKRTLASLKVDGDTLAYYEFVKDAVRKSGRLRKQRKRRA